VSQSDQTYLDFTVQSDAPDYLPGARLLALMAHPPISKNDTRWQTSERALGRLVWKMREQLDRTEVRRPQQIVPDHLTLPEATALKEFGKIRKQLDARMGAVHVVMPYLQAIERATERRLNALSIDQQIQRTMDQEEDYRAWMERRGTVVPNRFGASVDNFDNRVLRPSLPVIHLAVATAIHMELAQRELKQRPEAETAHLPRDQAGPQISYADILSFRGHSLPIIERANQLADLVMRLNDLRPPYLVRLRVE